MVVGGSYPVQATDLYQKVIGGFAFQMGAVVGILLFIPAALAFLATHLIQRSRDEGLDGRAVVHVPEPHVPRDAACLLFCGLVALAILAILVMAVCGSLFRLWPYNLAFSLGNYRFAEYEPSGWGAYLNSLKLASATALAGTAITFCGAYVLERTRGAAGLRGVIHFLCIVPQAMPGMVLGLSYIFLFNSPGNPLGGIYGTMAILVLSTVVHLYTVPTSRR
jgi:iron(III) transport system permease protein